MDKKCTKCGDVKDVGEFNKRKTTSDGLRYICKQCAREYRQSNKEQISERNREYHQVNKEQISERKREYHQSNPEVNAEAARLRRERINALPNNFKKGDYDYMLDYFDTVCVQCGGDYLLGKDHFIPITKDKNHGTVPTNIIPLCRSCNSKKAAKLPDEWFATFEPDERERLQDKIYGYFEHLERVSE